MMAMGTCQWSGVATITASTSGRARSSRKSAYALPPHCSRAKVAAVLEGVGHAHALGPLHLLEFAEQVASLVAHADMAQRHPLTGRGLRSGTERSGRDHIRKRNPLADPRRKPRRVASLVVIVLSVTTDSVIRPALISKNHRPASHAGRAGSTRCSPGMVKAGFLPG